MSQQGHLVIAAQGCNRAQQNLQPWRTHLEIVRHYLALGWRVSFVGDQDASDMEVGATEFVRVDDWNARDLADCVEQLEPSLVIWAVASTSVRHRKFLDLVACPVIALLTSPAYTWRQLIGGALGAKLHEVRALMMQQCVPGRTWRNFLEHPRISRIFVNSQRSLDALLAIGLAPGRLEILRVGLDQDLRDLACQAQPVKAAATGQLRCVYMGSPKAIRGFNILLKAMRRICFRAGMQGLEFRVLARGADAGFGESIRSTFKDASAKVEVIAGNMQRSDLFAEVEASQVVLLPFLLAPSDVPIAVLEAMALGAVVISTDVDGIPEMVRGRGVILKRRTAAALDQAIDDLLKDTDRVTELSQAAREYAAAYPTWEESLNRFVASVEQACQA